MEHQRKNLNGRQSSLEEWEQLGKKVLDTSKQELFIAMRYLFRPLNMLTYCLNRQIKFLATDGKQLYFNPLLLIERYKINPVRINRAYFHIIMHCLFRHVYDTKGRDRQLWDLACDICAEFLVDSISLSCVMQPENTQREMIYKRIAGSCSVMSAPNIYYALQTFSKEELDKLSASELFVADVHDYWYQNNDDNQEEQWRDAAKKMQSALAFDSGRGDTKGNLAKALNVATHKNVSYKDFLRKFAVTQEKMHIDMDSFDYGYYHYGLSLYGNLPLIEELEYKEETGIEDFVIVIDTSGSCASGLIQKFLNVTFSIFEEKENFFEKMNVHIIQCDNEVQEDTVISTFEEAEQYKNEFMAKGFGGTDFRPAFHYINTLRNEREFRRLKGVLYFTDGYGIYPEYKPAYDTVFVFLGDYDSDRKVPAWAMRFDLSKDAIENEDAQKTAQKRE